MGILTCNVPPTTRRYGHRNPDSRTPRACHVVPGRRIPQTKPRRTECEQGRPRSGCPQKDASLQQRSPGSLPSQTACGLRLVIEHHLPQLLLLGERGLADTIRPDCCQVRKEQFHNHFWLLVFLEVREKRIHAKVLKNFNHSVGPAAAKQAGRKGNFTHFSGIPSRFATLQARFAWVSTRFHQLVTRRLESSRCKPIKREFTLKTEDLPDTAAESMPVSSVIMSCWYGCICCTPFMSTID